MKEKNNTKPFYNTSIPSNWEVMRFDEFAPLQRGFDLPVEKIIEGKFPVVFSNGILKHHNEFKAKAPGVVTGRSGTIGKVTFVEEDYWPHNTALWVTDFKGNEPKFVYYFFNHYDLERFGTGSGVPTLNRNDVHIQKIIVPPLPEQKAIAHILGLMDTAINKNNQLIAKKELQKKWLMQNLLTGKKRLKLNGELKIDNGKLNKRGLTDVALGELGKIVSGGTPSTTDEDFCGGKINWVTPTEITGLKGEKYLFKTKRQITEAGLKK